MENWQIENICVDTMWNIIYSVSSFFNKKANLMAYIYGEIIDKIDNPKTMKLSALAKKKLFENNVVKYFSAVRDASVKAITDNETPSNMDIDGDILTERGFARLSTLSNINSKATYSPKTNKNIYLALGNALKGFTLSDTDYSDKGLFEVIYRYVEKHSNLYSSNGKTVANSFITNIENQQIIENLLQSYQDFLKSQIINFQRDMYQQQSDELSVKVVDDILREVDKEYKMTTNNFSSVISLNLPRRILLLHGIDTDSNKGARPRN